MRPPRAMAWGLAALALLLVAVDACPQDRHWDGSMPRILPYNEGDPVPDGYHVWTHPRRGLIVGGAVVLGAAYLANIVAVSQAQANGPADEYNALYAPIVGPFILAAQVRPPWLALADGLFQGGAVWMAVAGFIWPRQDLKRDETKAVVQVIPVVGGSTQGFAMVGQF